MTEKHIENSWCTVVVTDTNAGDKVRAAVDKTLDNDLIMYEAYAEQNTIHPQPYSEKSNLETHGTVRPIHGFGRMWVSQVARRIVIVVSAL